MNNLASKINTTLAEVDALPIKPPKVELQYGSTGYDKEQSFVIKGLIPECSFASIYGPSGSYKSFLALDWACHIATGKDWDGHKVKKGPCCMLLVTLCFNSQALIRCVTPKPPSPATYSTAPCLTLCPSQSLPVAI